MREFEPNIPNGSIQLPENTTTLVIENVPSDVAWKFITVNEKKLKYWGTKRTTYKNVWRKYSR